VAQSRNLPLLPTVTVGSHAYPAWFLAALEEIRAGHYGTTDRREAYDDAVNVAVLDQTQAGLDVISDGEMRRWNFIMSFFDRIEGLEELPRERRTGIYGYDAERLWRAVERLRVPSGLGLVEEYRYLRQIADRPTKVACPGPVTLTSLIRLSRGGQYRDRLELAADLVPAINAELRALVAEGADFLQIDEPAWVTIPAEAKPYVELFNAAVEGVDAKIALHVCFGNLNGRARGPRTYRPLFPALLEARCDQLIFEFANRQMDELSLWREFDIPHELGVGVIDVKSFWIETPEEVTGRLRRALDACPAERLYVYPDCGMFALPRWIARAKLFRLVEGTRAVRESL
jgi:5-methyltetrahydropteroyltriglutamate--homocysteine methyltransferase